MQDKTALVTGATSGIGRVTALELARKGATVIVVGRNESKAREVVSAIQNETGNERVSYLLADLSSVSATKALSEELHRKFDRLDVLVNNAGLASGLDKLQDGDVEDWDKMIDTNVKGLLFVSRQIIPKMIAQGHGHIVNIGSIAGKEIYPNGNVYCGTKHMVDALNLSMRRELAEHGIKVSAVNPGAVETEFSLVRLHGDAEKAKKVYEGFENLVAEDIADAIYYIISRPERVNINDLVIMPKAQPAAGQIIRDKGY